MTTMRMAAIAATVLLGTACGAGSADDDADADGGEAAAGLTIADFAFGEAPTIAAGEELTIENTDGTTHTVTADDGSFDISLGGGQTLSFSVDEPGEYPFACTIHPSMTSTLTVEG